MHFVKLFEKKLGYRALLLRITDALLPFSLDFHAVIWYNQNKKDRSIKMPYINLQTTSKVTDEKANAVKSALGKAISIIPGKSENWLMVKIEDGQSMWFRGDASADTAFVSVSVFGTLSDSAADKMTAEICDILGKELGIAPDRIYVRYSEHDKWGWNGGNF